MQNRIANTSSYRNFQSLDQINSQLLTRPAEYITDCERLYARTVEAVARNILVSPCPIVLLAGPSGSGKTTTSRSLAAELSRHGILAHSVELDNYFYSLDRSDLSLDWEAPARLDIPLILEHIAALSRGEEICMPRFDFASGERHDNVTPLRLGRNEVVIFEGIHALNDAILTRLDVRPVTVYVSARMRVRDETHVVFRPEWIRFLRRGLRDSLFRGTPLSHTLERWGDVRRGEKLYILPFKYRAQVMIDTSMDYEINLLAPLLHRELERLDPTALRLLRMARMPEALERFNPLSPSLIPKGSLMREFIGDIGL